MERPEYFVPEPEDIKVGAVIYCKTLGIQGFEKIDCTDSEYLVLKIEDFTGLYSFIKMQNISSDNDVVTSCTIPLDLYLMKFLNVEDIKSTGFWEDKAMAEYDYHVFYFTGDSSVELPEPVTSDVIVMEFWEESNGLSLSVIDFSIEEPNPNKMLLFAGPVNTLNDLDILMRSKGFPNNVKKVIC